MPQGQRINAWQRASTVMEYTHSTGGPNEEELTPHGREEGPHLRIRRVGGLVIVDVVNATTLVEQETIREMGDRLYRLVEEGHIRLLLNFAGVHYMSSDVLGMLAGLFARIERARGRLGLFGLDAMLRDLLRICHLDRVFEVFPDLAEALDTFRTPADHTRITERCKET